MVFPMNSDELVFDDHSFCFTGKMVGLKRTEAEREARARGGFTSGVVNERLDYIVIGSIPATGWKHGSYGRKIEKALATRATAGKPLFVPEEAFMDALAATPTTNSGEIDAKVLVATYKFLAEGLASFDTTGLEAWLEQLQQDLLFHVSVSAYPAFSYDELYGGDVRSGASADTIVVQCRFVRQLELHEDGQQLVDEVERGFERIQGVDGSTRWFERREGSSDYIRLLRDVPQSLRLIEP